ncbi:MAG: glycosyltransferase [Candidatus Micrarchaeia archaeon]|jgi:glycosyltransferase involved in cell wall biosynthesis
MLSIIIPAYNEEKRIAGTIAKLGKWLSQNRRLVPSFEVIVATDGTDSTAKVAALAAKIAKIKEFRVLEFPKRVGKGGAVSRALSIAKGDALLYDADAAVPPKFIATALREMKLHKACIVCGSREMPGGSRRGKIPLERRLATRAFNLLVNSLFGLDCTDSQCGFKLAKKSAYHALAPFSHSWYEWDVELLAKAKKKGLKVVEIPVEWAAVEGGKMKKRYTVGMVIGVLRLKSELS